jgi:hypothetical protein
LLAAPSQLPQYAPGLRRIVLHPAFVFDQVRHSPSGPQAGFIAKRFWPAFQLPLNAPQVFRTQARFAPGAPRLLEGSQSALLELLRPSTDRLPVHTHPAGYLALMNPIAQEFRGLKTPPL